jgi:hypothetical protein
MSITLFSRTLAICTIALLLISTHAHYEDGHRCAHNQFKDVPELLEVEEEFLSNQTRFLATASYPNLRITADYSLLLNGTAEFKDYVKNDLVPPVLAYFQAALAVKQPLTSTLKLSSSYKTICGYTTPKVLLTGVTTDHYLIISSTEDTENWVASAGSCYLSSTTKRPLITRMLFNMVYTKATTDVLIHEKNMYLTMHEMMHALGFTGSSFKNFIDANGKTLTGHIKTVSSNGSNRTVLSVEPLISKLRSHFLCSSLLGAYMEDDGGAGTEGSHFERRHFSYETMTSGVIHGRRISEFSLGVLEASGWYMPNYTYAEPYYFGKGEGCNFLFQDCLAKTFAFDEFCTGNSRGCTPVGRGGGICGSDSRSDNCSYYMPNLDYDCENPEAVDNARIPTLEVYGRGAGSRCFSGNLTKLTKSTQTSMCFKYNCTGSGVSASLQIVLGTIKVTCKIAGPVKVSGYNGILNCPNPIEFCANAGKKYCPRNCMGRGTCVNSVCKCKTGFGGIDCALNI